MTSIIELEEVQVGIPLRKFLWTRLVIGWSSMRVDPNSVLLTCSRSRTGGELCSSMSDEDYSYFSSLFEEVCQRELVELFYHARRALTVLAFVPLVGEIFSYMISFINRWRGLTASLRDE